MSRLVIATAVAAAAATAIVARAGAEDSYTTRIEPRAVYGATVSIEEGVRVFRPLPSEHHVIVNPGGLAPLSLGYFDPSHSGFYNRQAGASAR
jgi:hypothetical protein